MSFGLDMNMLPCYSTSAFKIFRQGEKHVTRIFSADVLILMEAGTLYFHEDGNAIAVKENKYYIQRCGLRQEGLIPSSNAKYYFLHFAGRYVDAKETLPLSGIAWWQVLSPLCRRLEQLRLSGGSQVEKSAVFFKILSVLKQQNSDNRNKEKIQRVVSEISENLRCRYTLSQIAQWMGYSKNQAINVFKKETGKTPQEYLLELRMDAAMHLLSESDMTIEEIARDTGFENYINFYKAFFKKYHCAPTAWRRNICGK